MKPGIIYRGIFVNIETDVNNTNVQQECTLNIYDTETLIPDADSETIIPLEMADNPVQIEVIDNSEDNFTPIRPKQLTANVFSSDSINISTFSEGGDNRYKVEYLTETENPFIGWLSISDLSQEFMPDPNIITLVAGDGLGFLKEIPLTDFDGDNPEHENQIMDYLTWILSKTGLQLNIVCCFNIRSKYSGSINNIPLTTSSSFVAASDIISVGNTNFFYIGQIVQITGTASNNVTLTVLGVTQTIVTFVASDIPLTDEANVNATFTDITPVGDSHFFKLWLHAKSGEADIGTSINCFDWLTNILKEEASIYQDNGTWFIMRKDEYEFGHTYLLFTFDYLGNFVSQSEEQFEKSIGVGLSLSWMNDNANVSLERPSKSVTETFDYLTPKEIPDNVDYDRGDVTTRVTEAGYTAYNLDDWAIGKLWGSATTLPTIDAVILRSFNEFSDEVSRFIMLTMPPSPMGTDINYIRSSAIPVEFQDKFVWSFDHSAMNDNNTADAFILGIALTVLYGNDGTVWTLEDGINGGVLKRWNLSDAEISIFRSEHEWDLRPNEQDLTEWVTFTVTSPPVPVSGELRFYLYAANRVASASDSFKIRYQNLSFRYLPYIGGSYEKYKGQYHKVEGGTNTVAVRDEKVGISDSPKRLFKNALLRISGQTVLHSGSVVFAAPNSASISGYKVVNFDTGKLIVTGTNEGVYTIDSIVYHVIGNTTEITFKEQTITTVTETATLSKYLFALANQFYNAAVYPNGDYPSDAVHPYGHLQVFDVCNQFNRTMSKADGTVDGLDTSTVIPDLKYKYYLTDANEVTNNKMFQLLHFSHEKHLCEWKAFLHEVADSTIGKTYLGNTFKYIT